eukprot:snap_masked-scaffold_4-processed-gene-8.32-mRNA-1 protein AED:1.00 eAED:1.00 QI:0/0/0/0/1/1/3/0/439
MSFQAPKPPPTSLPSTHTGITTDYADFGALPLANTIERPKKPSPTANVQNSFTARTGSPAPRPSEAAVSDITYNNNGAQEVLEKIPVFDTFSVLTVIKTIITFGTLYILRDIHFLSGFYLAIIGQTLFTLLNLVANMKLTKNPFYILLNGFMGSRFGWSTNKKEIEEDLGSKFGPKTMVAVAEILNQALVLYPFMILFAKVGSQGEEEGLIDLNVQPVIIVGTLTLLFHALCWLVSPYQKVSYGYIYFFTFTSFSSVFLFLHGLDQVTKDGEKDFNPVRISIVDSYYLQGGIYAIIRSLFGLFVCFGGLIEFMNTQRIMDLNPNYPPRMRNATLDLMQSFGGVLVLFDGISLIILLSNRDLFFFSDEDVPEEVVSLSLIDAVIFTNVLCSGWIALIAKVEMFSFAAMIRDRQTRISQHLSQVLSLNFYLVFVVGRYPFS